MTNNTDPVQALLAKWRSESTSDDQSSDYECGEHSARSECADELEAALAKQPAETSNARGEWVWVPAKPTEAMREAFNDWRPTEGNNYAGAQSVNSQARWEFRQRYAALLAAAPQRPAGEGEEE